MNKKQLVIKLEKMKEYLEDKMLWDTGYSSYDFGYDDGISCALTELDTILEQVNAQ